MDEIVQYIVVRSDLGMSPGKTAAQVAHASVNAVVQVQRSGTAWDGSKLDEWIASSYAKIVLGATAEEYARTRERCVEQNIPFAAVVDEGRTEIAGGTETAFALYPRPKSQVRKVVGRLRLL